MTVNSHYIKAYPPEKEKEYGYEQRLPPF